jgi:hypothetical protein
MARPGPFPCVRADAVGAEALEGLEEAVDLAGRDHRPGAADRECRLSGGVRGRDLDPAAVDVVGDRVVYRLAAS